MADADFDSDLPLSLTSAREGTRLSLDGIRPRSWQWRRARIRCFFKRAVDIAGAIVLAIVFSPMIIAIVLVNRRRGEPAFFRHERVGQHGRSFHCYKFRTMVTDADQQLEALLAADAALHREWSLRRKLKDDPRITRLGRILRRTSLDELPQIWNVLRGDMSLVGPRPVVREELPLYGRNLSTYLAAKPGLTGLWQVTGRSDTDYRRRVAMDVYYHRRQGVALDALILLKTVGVVLGGRGAY